MNHLKIVRPFRPIPISSVNGKEDFKACDVFSGKWVGLRDSLQIPDPWSNGPLPDCCCEGV